MVPEVVGKVEEQPVPGTRPLRAEGHPEEHMAVEKLQLVVDMDCMRVEGQAVVAEVEQQEVEAENVLEPVVAAARPCFAGRHSHSWRTKQIVLEVDEEPPAALVARKAIEDYRY